VPVGFEIACSLGVPLDVFLVRKLGMPGQEELALGAVSSGDVKVLNDELVNRLAVRLRVLEDTVQKQLTELHRCEESLRAHRHPVNISSRHIILVDDGLATGASMRAAVGALKLQHPGSLTIAVPVSSRDACARLKEEVDEIICGRVPDPFFSVGTWYEDFTQTSDEEVRELLRRAPFSKPSDESSAHSHQVFAG
jgi:putative phosphoribosyl transferase